MAIREFIGSSPRKEVISVISLYPLLFAASHSSSSGSRKRQNLRLPSPSGWAGRYPHRAHRVIVFSSSPRYSAAFFGVIGREFLGGCASTRSDMPVVMGVILKRKPPRRIWSCELSESNGNLAKYPICTEANDFQAQRIDREFVILLASLRCDPLDSPGWELSCPF